MARLPAAPAVLVLLAAALLSGCASPAPSGGDAERRDETGSDQGLMPSGGTSREVVLLPGNVVAWKVVVAGGQNLDLRFRVYQGLVDLKIEGPGQCAGFRVQAAVVSGPAGTDVQNRDCGKLEAGTYELSLHAGTSAFRGAVELRGGWFDGSPAATAREPLRDSVLA
jgi:hypothetical protein